VWNDVRAALRSLGAAPTYTAAAILTLAFAIAANTAIFAVVHAILLRPLPIHDPARLVVAWESNPSGGLPVMELSYGQFQAWSAHAGSFERLAAMSSSSWSMVLEGRGDPARVPSIGVSSSFFDTLGTHAALGRVFTPDDDTSARGDVVVLSHGTWLRRFGGDRGIVGSSITLDRRPYTVIGVMPRDFDFPRGTELWRPVVPVLTRSSAEWKTDALAFVRVLHVLGRLRPGVGIVSMTPGIAPSAWW
jgi:putative ABC transport system permease protein